MKTNLSQQMKDIFTTYSDEVVDAVEEALLKVGKEAADELKSGIGGFKDRTGKYRRSWTVTQEKHRTYTETTVHAKAPHYRLTHLLEFGHAIRGGGRSKDRTDAFPHISTVNEHAVEEAEKEIKRAIEKIR